MLPLTAHHTVNAWGTSDSVFDGSISDSKPCTPNALTCTTTAHIATSTTTTCVTSTRCNIALYTPEQHIELYDLLFDVTPKSELAQRTSEQEEQLQQYKSLAQSAQLAGDIDAAIMQYRSCFHIYNRTTDSFDSVFEILHDIIAMCKPTRYKLYIGIVMIAISDLFMFISQLSMSYKWLTFALEYLRDHAKHKKPVCDKCTAGTHCTKCCLCQPRSRGRPRKDALVAPDSEAAGRPRSNPECQATVHHSTVVSTSSVLCKD